MHAGGGWLLVTPNSYDVESPAWGHLTRTRGVAASEGGTFAHKVPEGSTTV